MEKKETGHEPKLAMAQLRSAALGPAVQSQAWPTAMRHGDPAAGTRARPEHSDVAAQRRAQRRRTRPPEREKGRHVNYK
jgi:hypothetical protein